MEAPKTTTSVAEVPKNNVVQSNATQSTSTNSNTNNNNENQKPKLPEGVKQQPVISSKPFDTIYLQFHENDSNS